MFMKKVLVVSQLALLLIFSSPSFALEGQGKIVEIQSCGSGLPDTTWRNYIFFKLTDGNWFGVYGNHGVGDYDSSLNHAILLTAFSMRLDVEVKATYSVVTGCGITASMHYANLNDYLRIVHP